MGVPVTFKQDFTGVPKCDRSFHGSKRESPSLKKGGQENCPILRSKYLKSDLLHEWNHLTLPARQSCRAERLGSPFGERERKGERKRERESVCVCVCVCVREKERKRMKERVSEREGERDRERKRETERESVCVRERDTQVNPSVPFAGLKGIGSARLGRGSKLSDLEIQDFKGWSPP